MSDLSDRLLDEVARRPEGATVLSAVVADLERVLARARVLAGGAEAPPLPPVPVPKEAPAPRPVPKKAPAPRSSGGLARRGPLVADSLDERREALRAHLREKGHRSIKELAVELHWGQKTVYAVLDHPSFVRRGGRVHLADGPDPGGTPTQRRQALARHIALEGPQSAAALAAALGLSADTAERAVRHPWFHRPDGPKGAVHLTPDGRAAVLGETVADDGYTRGPRPKARAGKVPAPTDHELALARCLAEHGPRAVSDLVSMLHWGEGVVLATIEGGRGWFERRGGRVELSNEGRIAVAGERPVLTTVLGYAPGATAEAEA